MMSDFLHQDPDDSGYVKESIFREILQQYVGYNLSEHQVITIVRKYRNSDYQMPSLPTEKLYAILQAELKRINFQFFEYLYMTFKERDYDQSGKLPKDVIRITLVSGFAASKSNLKSHNVNHIVEMLMKR